MENSICYWCFYYEMYHFDELKLDYTKYIDWFPIDSKLIEKPIFSSSKKWTDIQDWLKCILLQLPLFSHKNLFQRKKKRIFFSPAGCNITNRSKQTVN